MTSEFETTDGTQASRHPILVIHETVPRPDRSGCDARLVLLLRELVRQGHSIALIGRRASEPSYEDALRNLGIRVYSNDFEKLAYLGEERKAEWTLRDVLLEEKPAIALLFQWYWWGISIGEHYIDDIRQHSPETRMRCSATTVTACANAVSPPLQAAPSTCCERKTSRTARSRS